MNTFRKQVDLPPALQPPAKPCRIHEMKATAMTTRWLFSEWNFGFDISLWRHNSHVRILFPYQACHRGEKEIHLVESYFPGLQMWGNGKGRGSFIGHEIHLGWILGSGVRVQGEILVNHDKNEVFATNTGKTNQWCQAVVIVWWILFVFWAVRRRRTRTMLELTA